MLDEPFAGIDPVTVQSIQAIIRDLANKGIAILITDHAAREILQITDRTYVVNEGRILVSGSSAQITQNEIVRAKYLGDINFAKEQSATNSVTRRSETMPLTGESVDSQPPSPKIRFKSRSHQQSESSPLRSTDLD